MKVRGDRECTDCGTRWSYYETGEITCPDCGSIKSIGVGERAEHTDSPVELDLQPAIDQIDVEPLSTVAETASEQAKQYLRRTGFVNAGHLKPFDDRYLIAAELRRVGATLARSLRISEAEELYLLSLLRGGTDGDRPAPQAVPDSLRAERGLSIAAAVEAYVSDLRRVRDDTDSSDSTVSDVLSAVRANCKRIEALDGDIDPEEAEQLVRALRDVSAAVREGDETALARASGRFDGDT